MFETTFEEGQRLIRDYECGECGGALSLAWGGTHGVEGYVIICGQGKEHSTIRKIRSLTQAYRQGEGVPATVADAVERRMMPSGSDIERALNMLAIRYPSAELDRPSAALFLMDCMRLGLDPLLGEAVPVPFHSKRLGKKIVTPIITEDGYLSMAARACPERWAGPPKVEPVTDSALKLEICNDEKAWVWKAIGRTKDMEPGQMSTAYGWYKTSEQAKADDRVPAKGLPGNQARVRAIKRWVRENFPEARAKMKELTAEWMAKAEGVKEAQAVIEAEYRVFDIEEPETQPPQAETPPSEAGQAPAGEVPEAPTTTTPKATPPRGAAPIQQAWDQIRAHLEKAGPEAKGKAAKWLAMTSGQDILTNIFDRETPPLGRGFRPQLVYQLAQKLKEGL